MAGQLEYDEACFCLQLIHFLLFGFLQLLIGQLPEHITHVCLLLQSFLVWSSLWHFVHRCMFFALYNLGLVVCCGVCVTR